MRNIKFTWCFLVIFIILALEILIFHYFDNGRSESRFLFNYFGIFNLRHYKPAFDWPAYAQMLWVIGVSLFLGLMLNGWVKIFSLILSLGMLGNILPLYFFGYVGDWIGIRVTQNFTQVAIISDIFIFIGSLCFCCSILIRIVNFVFEVIKNLYFLFREKWGA